VIGPVDESRTAAIQSKPGAASTAITPALLVAAVVFGTLAGLVVVQLLLRRRRA
jgi:hypothetical protein